MPIRPENRARYPKDWKRIRAAVLERAGNRCETCGLPNYAVGYRDAEGELVSVSAHCDPASARKCIAAMRSKHPEFRWLIVVLTIAHLNHVPEDCRMENLRALCQQCHLRYDARMKADGLKQRREESRHASGLFAKEAGDVN